MKGQPLANIKGMAWSSYRAAMQPSWPSNSPTPLGWEHHSLETRRFPDTEGYIRIPSETIDALRKEPVVVVSNTFPDSGIVETLLMLDAIQDVRAGRLQNLREIGPQTLPDVGNGVVLAIPYFGYSDKTSASSPVSQFPLEPSLTC